MMTCKEVAEHASDLIDGELGLWQRLRVRLHLAICRGCANFLAQLRQTRALSEAALQAEPEAATEPARIDAILSQLHDPSHPGARRPRRNEE